MTIFKNLFLVAALITVTAYADNPLHKIFPAKQHAQTKQAQAPITPKSIQAAHINQGKAEHILTSWLENFKAYIFRSTSTTKKVNDHITAGCLQQATTKKVDDFIPKKMTEKKQHSTAHTLDKSIADPSAPILHKQYGSNKHALLDKLIHPCRMAIQRGKKAIAVGIACARRNPKAALAAATATVATAVALNKSSQHIMDAGQNHESILLSRCALALGADNYSWYLRDAIRHNNLSMVQFLVNHRANMAGDVVTEACWTNSLPIAEFLVERGAPVHSSALHGACQRDSLPLAALLLRHGVDSNYREHGSKYTNVELACSRNQAPIVALLMEHGGTIDNSDLLAAKAAEGNLDMVRCLVEHGASLTREGPSPLLEAIRGGRLDIIEYLVARGVNINEQRHHKDMLRPLQYAVTAGCQAPIIRFLTERVNSYNCSRALREAVNLNNQAMTNTILEQGHFDHYEQLIGAIEIAIQRGNWDTVRTIITSRPALNPFTEDGRLLCQAVQHGCDLAMLQYLVNHHARIDFERLFIEAASANNKDMFFHLVSLLGKHGKTWSDFCYSEALGFAIKHKNLAITEFIIEHTDAKNIKVYDEGMSAGILFSDYAHFDDHIPLRKGGPYDKLLGDAILNNMPFKLICMLVDKGVSPNECIGGRSPLIEAINKGFMQLISFLVERGGIVNLKVLMAATSNTDDKVFQYLYNHYKGTLRESDLSRLFDNARCRSAKDLFGKLLAEARAREYAEMQRKRLEEQKRLEHERAEAHRRWLEERERLEREHAEQLRQEQEVRERLERERTERLRQAREEQETKKREDRTQQAWIDRNQLSMSKLIETIDGWNIARIANTVEGLANADSPMYEQNAVLRWQKTLVATENLLPEEFRERFPRCTDKFRYRKLSILVHPDKTSKGRPEIAVIAERIFKALANAYGQLQEDPGQHPLQ